MQIPDRLPTITIPKHCISIRASVDGITFLKRVKKLLTEVNEWCFKEWEKDTSLGTKLILSYYESQNKKQIANNFICQLFGNENSNIIQLNFSANKWKDNKLNYNIYVNAAKKFNYILKVYNNKYRTRKRLRITKKETLEPKLTPIAKKFFNWFIDDANKIAINTSDWESLYAFILYLNSKNIKLSQHDFKRLLILNEFSDEYSSELSEFYLHARNLLYLSKNSRWNTLPPQNCWNKWLF